MNKNNKEIEIHIETDEEYGRRVSRILEKQPDYLQDVLRAIIYPKNFPKFGELTEGESNE